MDKITQAAAEQDARCDAERADFMASLYPEDEDFQEDARDAWKRLDDLMAQNQ